MLTPEQGTSGPPTNRGRTTVLSKHGTTHPERFVRGVPKPKPLPEAVWINPPTTPLSTQEIALLINPVECPIVVDRFRHGPAQNEATYRKLRLACESLLTDVVARHAIRRWGPAGLNPLVPSSAADDDAVRPLLAELAGQGAMPLQSWGDAARALWRGKKQRAQAVIRRLSARKGSIEARRYRFVIPTITWAPKALQPTLSLLCPRLERQLDPRTHPDIVRLLSDQKTAGFWEDFITFDEDDALSRMTEDGNQYFGGIANREREFAEPLIAISYLDLINQALDEKKLDKTREKKLIESLKLPDRQGRATSIPDCYTSAPLPSDIPGLRLPPILHDDVAIHPLFRRKTWRRPKYTMARFLEGDTIGAADEDTRRRFWRWLRKNQRHVARRERPKLADLSIWPDQNGDLCRIPDLCDPRSRRVGTILANSIHRPNEEVRRSKLVSIGSRARTSIRRIPTGDEVGRWIETRMADFTLGETPGPTTVTKLRRFEADLAILLKDKAIARLLHRTEVSLPALAQDGSMQSREELVVPGRANDRLALPARILLRDRQRGAILNKLSPALTEPTAAMLLDTFAEDCSNFSSLHSRLEKFLGVTKPEGDERSQLAEMAILPVNDQPHPPSALAFTRPGGDYWGNAWKIRISGQGLSQEDQRRYRQVGVTSASPKKAETSRAFLEWLSTQDQAVLECHIPCVLRHVLHGFGPSDWSENFTDTCFIPVRGQTGLALVSLRTAQSSPVYLDDAGDIGGEIIRKDSRIFLAIDRVSEVTEPISEPLRKLGVRSLREHLKEPEQVTGTGNPVNADENILVRFRELRSSQFRRTFLKRINALDVDVSLVRRDWHHRLSQIQEIRFADEVRAYYRFYRKLYEIEADAGFDPDSCIFWIRRHLGVGDSRIYESLAKQLVFKPTARRIDLYALKAVVQMSVDHPSLGRPDGSGSESIEDDVAGDYTSHGDEHDEEGVDADPGEAIFGHSPFEPDQARNTPHPRPISSKSAASPRQRDGWRRARRSHEDQEDSRPAPQLEKDHVESLKRDHYASHCQMCLCKRAPRTLAPAGSYIEWEEVRRRVVEAHHVDLKSAGGARHAGNLLLLCKLHHDNFGRRCTGSGFLDKSAA